MRRSGLTVERRPDGTPTLVIYDKAKRSLTVNGVEMSAVVDNYVAEVTHGRTTVTLHLPDAELVVR